MQYTSESYQRLLKELGFEASMSRAGKCLNNGNKALLWELESERRHYKLGKISPVQYEMELLKSA